MKQLIALIAAILMAGIATGCNEATDPFAYNEDPVARATGARWSWEGSQHYDAGVTIIRDDNVYAQYRFDGRMAFDINNNPVQVNGAAINGSLLHWNPTEQSLYHANIYESQDSTGFGTADSATFSYTGYDGESWSDRIRIAPDFAPINAPDTVSISQGLTIQYQNSVPSDSIRLSIAADGDWTTKPSIDSLLLQMTLPDSGIINIPASKLPHPFGTNDYVIQLNRFQFSSQISPKGKVIGIYSEMDATLVLNAKP